MINRIIVIVKKIIGKFIYIFIYLGNAIRLSQSSNERTKVNVDTNVATKKINATNRANLANVKRKHFCSRKVRKNSIEFEIPTRQLKLF